MANYYFLITAFPPLSLNTPLEFSFKDLDALLQLNLTATDQEKVNELLRPIDLYNLRAFWLGMPLDDRGRITVRDWEEELLVQGGIPLYIIDYLERYETTEDRLQHFASLYASMYRDEETRLRGFLQKYFQFERELRLVLIGLRAKAAGKDLVRELQFEDPKDPLVLEILSQKDAPDFTPPAEFEEVKLLFAFHREKPLELHRALLAYQFQKIEEMEEPQEFGVDRVLAYVAKFLCVESLARLNKEKGMEQLNRYE